MGLPPPSTPARNSVRMPLTHPRPQPGEVIGGTFGGCRSGDGHPTVPQPSRVRRMYNSTPVRVWAAYRRAASSIAIDRGANYIRIGSSTNPIRPLRKVAAHRAPTTRAIPARPGGPSYFRRAALERPATHAISSMTKTPMIPSCGDPGPMAIVRPISIRAASELVIPRTTSTTTASRTAIRGSTGRWSDNRTGALHSGQTVSRESRRL